MIIPLPKEKLKIVVGDHTRSKNEGTEQIVRVKDYFPHPSYQKNVTHDNDFAIIKLAKEVKFTKYVNPICLPQTSSNFESVETTASGWGSLQELYSGTHDILQKVHRSYIFIYEFFEPADFLDPIKILEPLEILQPSDFLEPAPQSFEPL